MSRLRSQARSRKVGQIPGIELDDPQALTRRYEYYDPIYTLPETGQPWWREHGTASPMDAAHAAPTPARLAGEFEAAALLPG